ncbi:glutamate-1-semialdehyde 2,1-aminomutase [Gammaproteobacteria bacterium]|nr:glutamate-1-semialdehyde 2,1-aminomutase [Gammaproteobacteria bacterium]
MKKINTSEELFKEAQTLMPGGVNSPVRAFKNIGGSPIFFKSAKGAFLYDEDDNEYVDFIGSWGPMIMGHTHPKVVAAVKKQIDSGTSFGAPTRLESNVAKLIQKSVPSIEKIRMVNSGTEATMSCIRLARGCTGKNKIIKFTGCYHGHADSLLVKAGSGVSTFGLPDSPGVPVELASLTISCPYNDKEHFLRVFDEVKDDLAAIIIEPVAGNMGFVPGDKSFLELIREVSAQNKSILIFDEVMSGFRVALGGAQELYNIKPDLTALGKVIGAGLPVGAFGGRADLMDQLAPEGPIYQAGTLSGNPLAMAAGEALLTELIKTDPYKSLEMKASYLLNAMSKIMESNNIDFVKNQMGGMFGFFFASKMPNNFDDVVATNDKVFVNFLNACMANGIYFAPSKYEAGFISTMHDENVLNTVIEKIELITKEGL